MYVYGELKNAQPEFFTNALMPSASAPGNVNRMVFNTDTKQLLISDGTRWVEQGSKGGSKNYFQQSQINPDFEGNTVSPWTAFTTTLSGGVPTTITASATQMAISATATTPLAGSYSMLLTKSAANAVGQGFISNAFTIDREDLGKVLTGSFYYEKVSGTVDLSGTSTQSLEVWVYNVTGAYWIQPTGYRGMNQGTGAGRLSFTFQADANAANNSYRIVVLTAQTDTNAYSFEFDDFSVSPQTITQGTPVTDWAAFTPTTSWVTNTTVGGQWRRVGSNLEVRCRVLCTGAPTATTLTITLPFGLTANSAIISIDDDSRVGYGTVLDTGTQRYFCFVNIATTTTVKLAVSPDTGAGYVSSNSFVTQALPFTFASGDQVDISFSIPITGWSSQVQMSNDTDTRVVVGRVAGGTPAGTISTVIGSSTNISGMSSSIDTHGAFSANTYTIPVSGIYEVTAQAEVLATYTTNQNAYIAVLKNNTEYGGSFSRAATSMTSLFPTTTQVISCNAGDTITIRCTSNGTTPTYGTTSPFISIKRLSGPSVVAANEVVMASYSLGSVQSTTTAVEAVVILPTKNTDTHNAYNTSTGLFTCPISGKYLIAGSVAFVGSASGERVLYARKNGAAFKTLDRRPGVATTTKVNGSMVIDCNAGDTLAFSVIQNSGGALNIIGDASENTITVTKVG